MPAAPLVAYHSARPQLADLDVIAFEGRGLVSRAIRAVTGGTVTHVGLVVRVHGSVMLLESREFRGHRIAWLSREIELHGPVLWYRSRALRDDDVAREARDWAIRAAGAPYSYLGCVRFLRRVLPFLRPPAEDRLGYEPRFCSAFVSAALRLAGADPLEDVPDAATSPAALVAADSLELLGRLEVVPR